MAALSIGLKAPAAWGKGKFDPRQNVDGLSKPVVIPPDHEPAGIHRATFTGDGTDLAYWNRQAAVAEMGGLGSVSEPRLNLQITNSNEDRVSSRLPALQAHQLSLSAPAAPAANLIDVVRTYNRRPALGLTEGQLADLSEYLKSL